MDSKLKLIVDSIGREKFKFDEPLKDYTFLEVGGPAKLFFIAFTTKELVKIVTMCKDLELPYFLFGTGSKIMISDNGFDGLVIKNRSKNINTVSVKGKVTKLGIGIEEAMVEVDSGVSLTKFAEYLDSQGLQSLEFGKIPGSIGGNLFVSNFLQNKLKSIKILDLDSDVYDLKPEELSLKKHIILSAIFRIKSK